MFLANYGDVLTDAPLDRIVDDFVASDAVASLLAVPPQASLPRGRRRRRRPGSTRSRGGRRCRCGSTAATSCCGSEIFDVSTQGEDLVTDALRPARRRSGKLHGRAATTGSGRRWTPSRSAAQLEDAGPQRPGAVEALGAGRERPSAAVPRRPGRRLTGRGDHRSTCRGARAGCSPSARTRTTSRSAAAARCCSWRRGGPDAAGRRASCSPAPPERQPRPGQPPSVPAGRDVDVRLLDLPRRPAAGGLGPRSRQLLEDAGGRRRRRRPGARPRPRRRAPGPPARSPSSPRPSGGTTWCSATRSPSGTATSAGRTLRAAARDIAAAKVALLDEGLPVAARPRLVGRGDVPRPGPAARHGVPRAYAEAFAVSKATWSW